MSTEEARRSVPQVASKEPLIPITIGRQKTDVWLDLACLHNRLSGRLHQQNGTSFNCLNVCPSLVWEKQRVHGKGRLKRDSDLIVPEPPVVTSKAGIPETRRYFKQGWALSKTGSQCFGAGAKPGRDWEKCCVRTVTENISETPLRRRRRRCRDKA